MLDFESESFEFKFNGVVYKLDYPLLKHIKEFRRSLKESEDDLEALTNFICNCGGEREVIESLNARQLNAIAEELSGIKKK